MVKLPSNNQLRPYLQALVYHNDFTTQQTVLSMYQNDTRKAHNKTKLNLHQHDTRVEHTKTQNPKN